jgi:formamidopyrimidine-DNA glycosylase
VPELPDITVYLKALERRILGERLGRIRIVSPSVLRTFDPPLEDVEGRRVEALRRLGKRIVWEMDGDVFVAIHLMVSGRLRWRAAGAAIGKGLAAFDFPTGTVVLTEASKIRRASLHIVRGEAGLAALDPGGIDPLTASTDDYAAMLRRENRTLKRALTDPRSFSGIGNAYSDEILHRAGMSPVRRTAALSDGSVAILRTATIGVLTEWTQRLLDATGDRWPEKVTAFQPEMAVHGKFGEPCPVCGSPVQRIVQANNETNYCARCQTGGRLLADRALSRLLRDDRPKRLEDL